ncbi:uncharacterized protein LOC122263805 [Penaeus japonicus]|uniref:uncharacterized protein LOC122263805 n=1 Tax=Penaeus japonicus TaxID=27405 RepID=UPI001C717910|nr:uncharacterized protein LOC122263805 [Penaeus japonicus]
MDSSQGRWAAWAATELWVESAWGLWAWEAASAGIVTSGARLAPENTNAVILKSREHARPFAHSVHPRDLGMPLQDAAEISTALATRSAVTTPVWSSVPARCHSRPCYIVKAQWKYLNFTPQIF